MSSAQGRWGYRRVRRAFKSQQIISSDGELDRRALASLVFKDPIARRNLNAATHLPVLVEIVRQLLGEWISCKPVAVVDMPLLFETGFYRICSPTILVRCSPDVQLNRLMERDDLNQSTAEARMNSQMPMKEKAKLADVIIDNNGTLTELERSVRYHVGRLLSRSWIHRIVLSPIGIIATASMLLALNRYTAWP